MEPIEWPRRPKARSGECAVCKGEVTEKFHKDFGSRYGSRDYSWRSSGLFCQACGISYHKLPGSKNTDE